MFQFLCDARKMVLMKSDQSGNVLFYLFIVVALLAALSYVVAQSGRGGVSGIEKNRSVLVASEILDYSNMIETAFGQLRLRGCNLNEISFENSVVSSYVNPAAPTDMSCHLFDLNGAALNWQDIPQNAMTSDERYGQYYFNATNDKTGTLSTDSDLLMIAEINLDTCVAINEHLNVDPASPPLNDPNGFDFPDDTYAYKGSFGSFVGGILPYENYLSGCFQDGSAGNVSSGRYYFYKVLVER